MNVKPNYAVVTGASSGIGWFVAVELAKRGYSIVGVSNQAEAVMPFPVISLYGPSKTFIRHYTKALGFEMKGSGVHVSCLLPGATATALYDPEKVNVARAIKLGVMKTPETVAKAGVEALFKNKSKCIPGAINKIIMLIIPLLPNFLIDYIYRKKKNKLVN